MRRALLLLIALAVVAPVAGQARETERERLAMQAELNGACEVARQKKLIPLRSQYVEECVEKRPDRESCERFYADYGSQSGNRAPLFYDLPECVTAFEYNKSYRHSNH